MSDAYALMDPLLSHLPAQKDDNWRIGHIIRNMPMGYFETYAAGKNQIADPSLHEYYDKILTIISGPIWSVERFKTIWKMNTGGYDYLLANYLKYQ